MRRTKFIALWGLVALLLVASAATVFLATAGDEFYRWAMRHAIEGTIDREIRVDGSFTFNVGPEPVLIVTDVWIENAQWASKQEMARAKRVEIQLALGPLFSGIVRIPRLIVEGLNLDLETSSGGRSNWKVASAGRNVIYPLLEFVSFKDIAINYRDHQSGRTIEILLDFLRKKQSAGDSGFEIQADGSFNRRTFQVTGRLGSIEQALAASAPFPLDLTLRSSSLVVNLAGSAQNVAAAEGFDISLTARTSSIGKVLRAVEIDVPLVGLAKASARLQGNLKSLAIEDIDLEVIDPSGQEFRAEGRIASLIDGRGLDLRFTGKLGPEVLRWVGDLPPGLSGALEGTVGTDLMGRITGDVDTLVVEDLHVRLEHRSGAGLSLRGHVGLDLSNEDIGLSRFQATALLSLPDRVLLERALGTRMPDLGAIHATAELTWDGDWVTLRSTEVKAKGLARSRLHAEGRIGTLSGKNLAFELDPRIGLSVAFEQSQPLVYLIERLARETRPIPSPPQVSSSPLGQERAKHVDDDLVLLIQRELKSAGLDPGLLDGKMGPRTRAAIEDFQTRRGLAVDGRASEDLLRYLRGIFGAARRQASPDAAPSEFSGLAGSLPELGPITATARLFRRGGTYRLDDLNLSLGAKDMAQVEVTGTLGTLRSGLEVPLEKISLAVNFSIQSSRTFSNFLPAEAPEFRKIKGRFRVKGNTEALSISNVRMTAEGPDGMVVTASGEVAKFSIATGLSVKGVTLDLNARLPDVKGVSRIVDLDLPNLGPVWARATLRDRGKNFTLTDINIATGSLDQPAAQVKGEIGDLLAMKSVALTGKFDVATATLLGMDTATQPNGLGNVHGRFDLSDTDGSIGLEELSAEIEDSKLLSLSIKGLFGDIGRVDDLRMQAALTVPDVYQLGRKFGLDFGQIGSLSFSGEVSGSDEQFHAEGDARIGATEVRGTLSGSFEGERPTLRAKLYSPLFRLANVGLVPQADAPNPASKGNTPKPAGHMVFGETPIPFELLKEFDLDLDVLFKEVEGAPLQIDNVETQLDVVDGVLRVESHSFNLADGRVDSTLRVDARGVSPKLHLRLTAADVDLNDLLSQVEVNVPLSGKLDLSVDLKAAGQSPRSLASSLRGDLDLAVQRGRVYTNQLRLTTTNPISWLFTDAARKGYSDMNCLILRFKFQDGLADSQSILLDTPNIRALGKGQIDLRKELISIEVSPWAKGKEVAQRGTPFTIEGKLVKPSVKVSAAGVAVRTAGEVLLSPVHLLGSLLPFVSDRGAKDDNPCLSLQNQ
jgi:uncharacterized protein involved in outer membrane biogenesis